MAYEDALVIDHIKNTHATEVLSEREKHLIGLARKVEGKVRK